MLKEMGPFEAAMIADGEWDLAGFEANEENYFRAYQYLVDSGMAWTLQGRIGREAHRLLEAGVIQPAGKWKRPGANQEAESSTQ